MTKEESIQQIEAYRLRFQRIAPGGDHLLMAQLASFPIAITAHLLYQLWVNFKNLSAQKEGISVLAVNDCILSNLFAPTGKEVYEMDNGVREQLKLQFKSTFAPGIVKDVVSFLYHYARQYARGSAWKNYSDAQEQAAIMEMDPALAAKNALHALAAQLDTQDTDTKRLQQGIGISNMITTLARDSNAFATVIEHALTNSNSLPSNTNTGNKTLLISDTKLAHAATVRLQDLPFAISERLKPLFVNKLKKETAQQSGTSNGTVYALMVAVGDYADPALRLEGATRGVIQLRDCLVNNHLLEEGNCTLLLDGEATKQAIEDHILRLLTTAQGPGDTVLVYFAGQGQRRERRFLLRDFDETVKYVSQQENYIEDTTFNRWLMNVLHRRNVVLIMDSGCSSNEWIAGTPGGVGIFSCWPDETMDEGKAGHFTTSLVNAINQHPAASYRQLLNGIIDNMQRLQVNQPNELQLPYFKITPTAWNHRLLSGQPVGVSNTYLQQLINKAGYALAVDGIMGPATAALLQLIRDEVTAAEEETDEDVLQKFLLMRNPAGWQITCIGIGSPVVPAEVQNLLRMQSTLFHYVYHLVDVAGQHRLTRSDVQRQLSEHLFNSQVLLVAVSAEELASQLFLQVLEKYAHAAFARYMPVYLLRIGEAPLQLTPFLSQFPTWPAVGMDISSEAGLAHLRDGLEALGKDLQRFVHASVAGKYSLEQRLAAAKRSEILDLSNLNLGELPPAVFDMTGLKELNIAGNQLQELPADLANLKALRVLNISNNDFQHRFPQVIFQLRNLRKLDVSGNFSYEGYQGMNLQEFDKLEALNIANTGLRVLDPLWLGLQLKALQYEGNPILNLPPELLEQQVDAGTLRNYFKDNEASLPPEQFAVIELNPGQPGKFQPGPEFYRIIYQVDTTAKLFATLTKEYTPNTLFFINDEDGILRRQFGEYDDRVFNIRAFFSAVHLSLNVIVNMNNVNLPELWTDLVNGGTINFVAVRNNEQGEVQQFILDFYQRLKGKTTGFRQLLQSLDKQVAFGKSGKARTNATALFDYYFNLQQLNDLQWPVTPTVEANTNTNTSFTAPASGAISTERPNSKTNPKRPPTKKK